MRYTTLQNEMNQVCEQSTQKQNQYTKLQEQYKTVVEDNDKLNAEAISLKKEISTLHVCTLFMKKKVLDKSDFLSD